MMWLRIITIVCSEGQNVFSESFIVSGDFAQPACSHLCYEDMGNMGKEPNDTCIPHWLDFRMYSSDSSHELCLTDAGGWRSAYL